MNRTLQKDFKPGVVKIIGYEGIGDNLYQRPVVRAAMKHFEAVYLETPWPQLYWDLVDQGLKFVRPESNLRTQKANVAAIPQDQWSCTPAGVSNVTIQYDGGSFGQGLNPVQGFGKRLGVEPEKNFDLPVHPDWLESAHAFLRKHDLEGKDIALVHPATLRREWFCPARNPRPEYLQQVVRQHPELQWVSIAWVNEPAEWLDGGKVQGCRVYCDRGELDVTTILGLMKLARAVVTPVGWFLPAAAALKVPCLTIFGGYIAPNLLIDEMMRHPGLRFVATDPFCNCMQANHGCFKVISPDTIASAFDEVLLGTDNRITNLREMFRKTLSWWPDLGIGYYPAVQPIQYDGAYWDEYRKRADTDVGRELTRCRVELVNRHLGDGPCIDIGIGSGQFVEARAGATYGYDVNPKAIKWLKNRSGWRDPYSFEDSVQNITCFDSLEHIEAPERLVARVRGFCIVSIPIFTGPEHILRSKHFKPNEHLWYFTEQGLERWFCTMGFRLVAKNRMEEAVGREDIGSFVFERVA